MLVWEVLGGWGGIRLNNEFDNRTDLPTLKKSISSSMATLSILCHTAATALFMTNSSSVSSNTGIQIIAKRKMGYINDLRSPNFMLGY